MHVPAPVAGSIRTLAYILAASFLAATVIVLLLNFDVTAPAPQFRQGESVLVDNILIDFANQQLRWPQDLAASLLFAIGFAAVAGLGATLPGLISADDSRARLVGAAFVVAGTVGLVGQLLYIGVHEVGTSSQYCECALRDAQLISRAETLNIIQNVQTWMTDGFAVIFGVGLLTAAAVARAADTMTAGWRRYTRGLGVAAIAFVLIGHLLTALGSTDLDLGLVAVALIAVVAGVLTPIWAVMTARLAR